MNICSGDIEFDREKISEKKSKSILGKIKFFVSENDCYKLWILGFNNLFFEILKVSFEQKKTRRGITLFLSVSQSVYVQSELLPNCQNNMNYPHSFNITKYVVLNEGIK